MTENPGFTDDVDRIYNAAIIQSYQLPDNVRQAFEQARDTLPKPLLVAAVACGFKAGQLVGHLASSEPSGKAE